MQFSNTVFGKYQDWFLIPTSFDGEINKGAHDRHETAAPMVSYRHIGSLGRQAGTGPLPVASEGGVGLVGVTVPLDSGWLDERVDALMGCFSHSLHLNFTHEVAPTIWNGPIRSGGYTRAISLGGARKRVQYLLQRLRTETYRLWREEFFSPTKSDRTPLSRVRGVIEFGSENLGIHAHLLTNFHPSISESWIEKVWRDDGASVRVHSLWNASAEDQRKAIVYVESRALQYSLVAGLSHEALSLNDYEEHLVIDRIDGHQKHERYHGRTTRSPRYRQQHLTY